MTKQVFPNKRTSSILTYPSELRCAPIGVTPVLAADALVVQSSRGGNRSEGAGLNDDRVIITTAIHSGNVIVATINTVVDKDLHLHIV